MLIDLTPLIIQQQGLDGGALGGASGCRCCSARLCSCTRL